MSNTPAMALRLRPMRRPRWYSRLSSLPPPLHSLALQTRSRFISSKREDQGQQPPDAGDRPFQTQLWDSTYQRVAREREERKKYGAMQQFGEGTASNALAWVACRFFREPYLFR
jgi:hypothetical protein